MTTTENEQILFSQTPIQQTDSTIASTVLHPVGSVIVVPVQFPGNDYSQKRTMLVVGEAENGDYLCNNFTSDKRYKDNGKYPSNVFVPKTPQNGLKYDSYIKCETQYLVSKEYKGIETTKVQLSSEALHAVQQRTAQLENVSRISIQDKPVDSFRAYTEKIQETLTSFKADPALFSEFAAFSAMFYSYSLNNKLLIYMQQPFSTFVASYTRWQQLGYNVTRSAKAIKIYRPIETLEFLRNGYPVNVKNATNAEKVKIGNGELSTSSKTSFVKYSVFDISQTNCPKEEYPKLYSMGYSSVEHSELYPVVKDFVETSGFTVTEQLLPSISLNGYCNTQTSEIVLNSRLEDTEKLNTLLHEFAHGLLHQTSTQPTSVKEFEAESLSMMLHHRLGLPIDENSKLYVCNSYKGIDQAAFSMNESFSRLGKAFHFIDKGLSKSMKEKGIDLSQPRKLSNEKELNISHKKENAANRNFIQEL